MRYTELQFKSTCGIYLSERNVFYRRSTLFLHGVCMLRERILGECAHEQHVRRTLNLTHTITAY